MQKQITQQGFTLIELLVAVLIISILAAMALPQYQKTVEKTRANEAVVNLRTLVNAENLYKLEHGEITTSIDNLPINISNSQLFNYVITSFSKGIGFEIIAYRKHEEKNHLKYYIYYSHAETLSCVTQHDNALPVCMHLCHITQTPGASSNTGYRYCNI